MPSSWAQALLALQYYYYFEFGVRTRSPSLKSRSNEQCRLRSSGRHCDQPFPEALQHWSSWRRAQLCPGSPARTLQRTVSTSLFDATGLQSTLDTGIAALRPGGTFFNVAIHEKPLQLNLNDIACLEKKIMGGICYTNEDSSMSLRPWLRARSRSSR